MSSSTQTIDSWPREGLRLITGFFFIGFALLLSAFIARENAVSHNARVVAYMLCTAVLILGILILLFHRAVEIDPVRRQASRILLLHRFVIHRKSWPFEDFRCIAVRHGSDEGTYFCSVTLRHLSGREIGLRSFVLTGIGLSDDAVSFLRNLEETTGLQYEGNAAKPA